MSKKTVILSLATILGVITPIALIKVDGWSQKSPSATVAPPVRGCPPGSGMISRSEENAKARALALDFGRAPVYFVPNRGQADSRVDFYVHGVDKTIYFAPNGLTFALNRPPCSGDKRISERWVVKLDFIGAREDGKPEGLEKTGATVSYFRGKPEEWRTGLTTYSRIIYRDLWPGIDLVYMGERDRLKYEFIVHPGADPSMIKLAYRGAEWVGLTDTGTLKVETQAGALEDEIPLGYQENAGERTNVPVAYRSGSDPGTDPAGRTYSYSFEVGEYDRSRTLVIDPAVLVYCGYIGGVNQDTCGGLAVDTSGNVYMVGITQSDESSFPVAIGPDLTKNSNNECFVVKVNPSGSGLVYCGYIGQADGYGACDIAIDQLGNAYIASSTNATEATFPVTGGPDLTHNGGLDCFVAKVNSSGTDLVYCGYIGGSSDEIATGIDVDDSGNAYVIGRTSSSQSTFPVAVGPDLTYGGSDDVFIARVNSSGTGLEYCGYIGGSQGDWAGGVAVDDVGNAYATGWTDSSQSTFPVAVGPDLTINGGSDDFVAKVNSSGTGLDYCGYIGGSTDEAWPKIAIDGSGNAYIAGTTYSSQTTFPVTVGPDLTYNGDLDVFIAKINPSGTGLIYCGYVGGSGWDNDTGGIAVDNVGNAYITGETTSTQATFPVVDGPDLTFNGGHDVFVAKINSAGTSLVYCGYIGGLAEDIQGDIAVDASGIAYINGVTESNQSSFPVVGGPDLTHNGGQDVFVVKVSDVTGPPITSLLPDSANAGDPDFLLSVIGSDFVDGAVVRWDGSPRPTTFISISELQAQVTAADLAAGKTIQVTVLNPNGGISNALPFTISNPIPTLSVLSTTHVTGGGTAFTLTVQGTNFVPNSVVRWNGNARTTTYVGSTELQAAITAADLATGGNAQVTVFNPAPAGGTSSAFAVEVSSYTLNSSPSSVTVAAGQSATYTVTLTPQFGSFDAITAFACAGLPNKCAATFSPPSATPGAAAVTTTLTLTTAAAAATGASAVSLTGSSSVGLPFAGLLALAAGLLLTSIVRRPMTWRLARPRLAACALFVLAVIIIGSCSSGGDGNNPPPYSGTPKGTHTISVQATSGNMTVPTSITLVVN